jgi:outer membrane protein insertion porin family
MVLFLSLFVGSVGHAASEDKEPDNVPAGAPIISSILIEFSDLSGDKTELIKMARDLIFIKEGDRFSAAKLQKSLELLKLSESFREINVDSIEEEGDRIKLLFRLTPFRLIKDIKISGGLPLFERQILNTMTIYTGDAFIEEELHKQTAFIEELFQREGFPVPIVNVTAREDKDDGFFIIQVNIEKGPYFTLEKLKITGNRAFSRTKLKLKMHSWRVLLFPGSSRRFIEEHLKKYIRNLTEYYWKKKYPDVHIDFKIEKDSQAKSISVFINIDEGPRYDIKFVGNDEFRDSTLKKDLILFNKGNKNDLGLKKSVRKIKERYRMAGYLKTRVKIEEETKTGKHETIRDLRFVIDEGPCSIVNSIEIAGNNALGEEKLKKQMLTRTPGFLEKGAFVPETFEQDLNAIKSLYIMEGYMDTKVREELTWSEDKSNISINLEIEEGPQTLVSSVKITGINVVSQEEAHEAIRLKKGKSFRKYMIRSDENALSALISEKGHPHVKVKGDVKISRDRSKADMVYTVDEGQYVVMGHVYYKGNLRTKNKVLQNELEIEPGSPFSLVDMVKGQRNIRNLDIFNSVQFKIVGLKEKEEEVNLFVEIEEKKPCSALIRMAGWKGRLVR